MRRAVSLPFSVSRRLPFENVLFLKLRAVAAVVITGSPPKKNAQITGIKRRYYVEEKKLRRNKYLLPAADLNNRRFARFRVCRYRDLCRARSILFADELGKRTNAEAELKTIGPLPRDRHEY